MSKIDENEIRRRLKLLSQIEPTPEAARRAIERVRDTLANEEKRRESTGMWRAIIKRPITKLAAAAVLLIVVGYVVGQLSAPRPPDVEKLQAAIRQDVLEEMKHYWQLGMASSYVQLKDELNEQYRRDLNEFAVRTVAASSAVTNRLLEELIESINAAKMEDLRRIADVLYQIELKRLQDKTQLTNGLETLAVHTGDELQRTRQDMVKLLVYRQPGSLVPKVTENSNNSNERKE